VQYNAGAFGGFTMGGDCTIVASTGTITVPRPAERPLRPPPRPTPPTPTTSRPALWSLPAVTRIAASPPEPTSTTLPASPRPASSTVMEQGPIRPGCDGFRQCGAGYVADDREARPSPERWWVPTPYHFRSLAQSSAHSGVGNGTSSTRE